MYRPTEEMDRQVKEDLKQTCQEIFQSARHGVHVAWFEWKWFARCLRLQRLLRRCPWWIRCWNLRMGLRYVQMTSAEYEAWKRDGEGVPAKDTVRRLTGG